jgi:hypothetical protein
MGEGGGECDRGKDERGAGHTKPMVEGVEPYPCLNRWCTGSTKLYTTLPNAQMKRTCFYCPLATRPAETGRFRCFQMKPNCWAPSCRSSPRSLWGHECHAHIAPFSLVAIPAANLLRFFLLIRCTCRFSCACKLYLWVANCSCACKSNKLSFGRLTSTVYLFVSKDSTDYTF